MLMCGIIDELNKAADRCRITYFFCQAADARLNNALAVVKGLIYRLLRQDEHLKKRFCDMYSDSDIQSLQDSSSWDIMYSILFDLLDNSSLQGAYVFIDALDECTVGSRELLWLVVKLSSLQAKVLVSSRNWPSIKDGLSHAQQNTPLCLELNASAISLAVRTYIYTKVTGLTRSKKLDKATQDFVTSYSTLNCNDTFLWVALVCYEIESPQVRGRHLKTKLQEFPPGLNMVYERMLEEVLAADDAELYKQTLEIMLLAYRPMSLAELFAYLESAGQMLDSIDYLQETVELCGSFLSLRGDTVYFMHQSAKDFLARESDKILVADLGLGHQRLALWSLQIMSRTLRRNLYDLSSPGSSPQKSLDPDPLAPARYACVYWVDHLTYVVHDGRSRLDYDDDGLVHRFLTEHLLHWIEVMSLLRSIPSGIQALSKLLSALKGYTENATSINQITTTSKLNRDRIQMFAHEAWRFIRYHKEGLEEGPLQVYNSGLIFTPKQSILRELFCEEEPKWMVLKPQVENEWNECLQTLEGHSGWVCSAVFSPDGNLVASRSHDKTIKLWNIATGVCERTFEDHDCSFKGHNCWAQLLALSPDGKLIASSSNGIIKLWDILTGICKRTLEGHDSEIGSIVFSPDGKLMLASYFKVIKIWDMTTECERILEGHSNRISSIAFSPDGKLVISGSINMIKLWGTTTGVCQRTLEGHYGKVNSITSLPDGKLLILGLNNKVVKLWDITTSICTKTLEGHFGPMNLVVLSPDGKLVVALDFEKIKVWDVATGKYKTTLKGHNEYLNSVVFSPDGKLAISCSDDKTIKLWDMVMKKYQETLEGHNGHITSVAFSADGKLVASGAADTTIKIWNIATGECEKTLEGHYDEVRSIVFSPNGKLIASSSDDLTIKLWDIATGECEKTLEGHYDEVRSIVFSPNGKLIASSSDDLTIKLWDIATSECEKTLEGHYDAVRSIVFSPNGKLIASGSDDMTIKLWDIATGKYIKTLEGHDNGVTSIAFSPDGKLIASGAANRTIKLWDTATGECKGTIETRRYISSLSFSPSGDQLNTNQGIFSVSSLGVLNTSSTQVQGTGISIDGAWVMRDGERLLWLPPEYRLKTFAAKNGSLAIGCHSGHVLLMSFRENGHSAWASL